MLIIVIDTLHASSSDLITWNTLVMIKLKWIDIIPRQWLEITTQSLEAWNQRDEKSPFLPDNRRGYARVTPVALSRVGVPNSKVLAMTEFPLHGLGIYDDYETWGRYLGYVWSGWTTRTAQPVHIDPTLQAMIDQSVQQEPSVSSKTYLGDDSTASDPKAKSKGSQVSVYNSEPPFPTLVQDVNMETSADKRSRESPNSTLKPEGKSLKTSGVAVGTDDEPVVRDYGIPAPVAVDHSNPVAPVIRWKVKEESEIKLIMRRFHHSTPAWKLKMCIDAMKVRPVDLASLAQETGVQFASVELVEAAVSCLEEITKEMEKDESQGSSAAPASSSVEASQTKDDTKPPQANSEAVEASTKDQTPCDPSADTGAAAQKAKPNTVEKDEQNKDALASPKKASPEDSCGSASVQSKEWIDRVTSAGHSILWPQTMIPSVGPTLLTGVRMGEEDRLVDDLLEWERKLENANLDNHMQFRRNAQLTAMNHPMEATAWENGYVPEAQGLPSDQLESRIQGSLPPLAYMVSRPKQPIAIGEGLLCRFDAGIRPYWLRDWQSGFGGYTKVYEYQVDGETRRRYSVAHVVRPRTNSTNACLCFTLLSQSTGRIVRNGRITRYRR